MSSRRIAANRPMVTTTDDAAMPVIRNGRLDKLSAILGGPKYPKANNIMKTKIVLAHLAALFLTTVATAQPAAAQQTVLADQDEYLIHAGDRLEISVWKEEDLQREVLVRPDGAFTFPLAGEIVAKGRTVTDVRKELEERLTVYIPELVSTVTVIEVSGNAIYVIGQVQNPGSIVMNPVLDVMQALSVAGGTTPFASLKKIRILRREGGVRRAMRFDYTEVSDGKSLEQNIILQGGDVVVVP